MNRRDRTCSVDGCPQLVRARELCGMHYERQRITGDVGEVFGRGATPLEVRFHAKVVRQAEGCWLWIGATTADGYGRIAVNGDSRNAHRISYEMHVGPIPTGLQLDHLCRVPSCVNPAHLEPVTQRENLLRGVGPAARNAAKTHCLNGHAFTPENTLRNRRNPNERVCRTCNRERCRRDYLARKAVA